MCLHSVVVVGLVVVSVVVPVTIKGIIHQLEHIECACTLTILGLQII